MPGEIVLQYSGSEGAAWAERLPKVSATTVVVSATSLRKLVTPLKRPHAAGLSSEPPQRDLRIVVALSRFSHAWTASRTSTLIDSPRFRAAWRNLFIITWGTRTVRIGSCWVGMPPSICHTSAGHQVRKIAAPSSAASILILGRKI